MRRPRIHEAGGSVRVRGGIIKPYCFPEPAAAALADSSAKPQPLKSHNRRKYRWPRTSLLLPRPPPNARPKNHLLRALPEAEFQRLRPDLKTIPTSAKQRVPQTRRTHRIRLLSERRRGVDHRRALRRHHGGDRHRRARRHGRYRSLFREKRGRAGRDDDAGPGHGR